MNLASLFVRAAVVADVSNSYGGPVFYSAAMSLPSAEVVVVTDSHFSNVKGFNVPSCVGANGANLSVSSSRFFDADNPIGAVTGFRAQASDCFFSNCRQSCIYFQNVLIANVVAVTVASAWMHEVFPNGAITLSSIQSGLISNSTVANTSGAPALLISYGSSATIQNVTVRNATQAFKAESMVAIIADGLRTADCAVGGNVRFVQTFYIVGCVFSRSNARGDLPFALTASTGVISSSRFEGCTANETIGGAALSVSADSNVTIEDCSFKSNFASNCGAIFSQGSATIRRSRFESNRASYGAAICAHSSSVTFVTNSIFLNNEAFNFIRGGGALTVVDSAIVAISNSQFVANTAYSGGACYVGDSGHLSITNSSFNLNIASSKAGDLYVDRGASATVLSSDFRRSGAATSGSFARCFVGALNLTDVIVNVSGVSALESHACVVFVRASTFVAVTSSYALEFNGGELFFNSTVITVDTPEPVVPNGYGVSVIKAAATFDAVVMTSRLGVQIGVYFQTAQVTMTSSHISSCEAVIIREESFVLLLTSSLATTSQTYASVVSKSQVVFVASNITSSSSNAVALDARHSRLTSVASFVSLSPAITAFSTVLVFVDSILVANQPSANGAIVISNSTLTVRRGSFLSSPFVSFLIGATQSDLIFTQQLAFNVSLDAVQSNVTISSSLVNTPIAARFTISACSLVIDGVELLSFFVISSFGPSNITVVGSTSHSDQVLSVFSGDNSTNIIRVDALSAPFVSCIAPVVCLSPLEPSYLAPLAVCVRVTATLPIKTQSPHDVIVSVTPAFGVAVPSIPAATVADQFGVVRLFVPTHSSPVVQLTLVPLVIPACVHISLAAVPPLPSPAHSSLIIVGSRINVAFTWDGTTPYLCLLILRDAMGQLFNPGVKGTTLQVIYDTPAAANVTADCPSKDVQVSSSFFCQLRFPASNVRIAISPCDVAPQPPRCGRLGISPASVWIGAIAIPASIVVVFLFLIAVVAVRRAHRRWRERVTARLLHSFVDINSSGRRAQSAPLFVNRDLVISSADLDVLRDVGAGADGVVSVALWKGQRVAVKRLYGANDQDAFIEEAALHQSLRHPNVVQLLAVTLRPPALILEFMSRGTLFALLNDPSVSLPSKRKNAMLSNVAAAMRFLHALGLVHRDLKSRNVLVNEDFVAKLADFGAAKAAASRATERLGAWLWAPPETFEVGAIATARGDVYSFGILMWEVWTRKVPYSNDPMFPEGPIAAMAYIKEGGRPSVEADMNPDFAELMIRCWDRDEALRPEFGEVAEALEAIADGKQCRSEASSGSDHGASDMSIPLLQRI